MQLVDIICPVYREEGGIRDFHAALDQAISEPSARYKFSIIYVLDPSNDGTEGILEEIARADERVTVIVMSRRFGHQSALIAGMETSHGDAVVMLDSDLQHPPSLIRELLRHWEEGAEVVQALRQDGRETVALKRATSTWFYRFFAHISPVRLVPGAADFRLLSRRVVDVFREQMREHNPFVRGLVSWVGFRTVYVPFTPHRRPHGRSKYSVSALLVFALNGIFSFSKWPLRACIVLGIAISIISFLGGFLNTIVYLFSDTAVPGWASLFALLSFVSGIQLLFLGLIGEYVSLIFDEVKNRPRYIVSHVHTGSRERLETPGIPDRLPGNYSVLP